MAMWVADAAQQALAGLGGRDAAGGAVQEAHPEPLLEVADGMAQGGLRYPELLAGPDPTGRERQFSVAFDLDGIVVVGSSGGRRHVQARMPGPRGLRPDLRRLDGSP